MIETKRRRGGGKGEGRGSPANRSGLARAVRQNAEKRKEGERGNPQLAELRKGKKKRKRERDAKVLLSRWTVAASKGEGGREKKEKRKRGRKKREPEERRGLDEFFSVILIHRLLDCYGRRKKEERKGKDVKSGRLQFVAHDQGVKKRRKRGKRTSGRMEVSRQRRTEFGHRSEEKKGKKRGGGEKKGREDGSVYFLSVTSRQHQKKSKGKKRGGNDPRILHSILHTEAESKERPLLCA